MNGDERLARHRPLHLEQGGAIAAAVLVPLCAAPAGDAVLFLKRAEAPDVHGGQFAFPGGKCDATDPDEVGTALREAWEEVGIRPEDVRLLGRLDPLLTVTGFHITPVVGRIPWPYDLVLNPAEVDRVLEVPLKDLLTPGFIRHESHRLSDGRELSLYRFEVGEDTIWGATARITRQLVSLLGGEGEILPGGLELPADS